MSVTRRVWDGRATLEEFETDGPSGHVEGPLGHHAKVEFGVLGIGGNLLSEERISK
jgi:hypothetical protein